MFAYLKSLWEGLFSTPLSELNAAQFIIIVIILVSGFSLVKALGENMKSGVLVFHKLSKKAFSSFSVKARAKKIPCPYCSRKLDSCVCISNRGLSLSKRIKKYKLEQKRHKLEQKTSKIK